MHIFLIRANTELVVFGRILSSRLTSYTLSRSRDYARGATSDKKALGELISLYQDELVGRGLYQQREATGDRIQQLQQLP